MSQPNARSAAAAMLASLALAAALLSSCNERKSPTPPAAPASAGPSATAVAPAVDRQKADSWLRVTKDGYELGVVELLAGKPWRVVLHSDSDDARALAKLVSDQGDKPIALSMHLPPEKKGERGPYGSRLVGPGDSLYALVVTP